MAYLHPRTTALLATALLVALTLMGCHDGGKGDSGDDDADAGGLPDGGVGPDGSFAFARCESPGQLMPELVEDRRVYQQDTLDVLTVDVTIDDLAAFAAVNANVADARAPVTFQDGTFGAGAVAPNATIQLRGNASRVNKQKNYKIQLTNDGEVWRGQREINLNKHMWDLTRVRNKMAFDIFQTVSHFTSFRTHFVQMFVNGEDYGLYTWIEEGDKRFLQSHGLDPLGQLYKAVEFYFQPIEPTVAADPVALALITEGKANADDAKLVRMLDAVNDETQDIDAVVDRYFNRDNLVTWLAVNVLLNNIDTLTQNFYLYSPSSCDGWYLLPWDYDGAWGFYGQLEEDDRDRWQSGLTNWWPNLLFRRFFTRPANVQAIHDRIVELSETVLTDEVVAARLASYHDVVIDYISVGPDLYDLPGHYGDAGAEVGIDLWEGELTRITSTVSRFFAEYLDVVERPMPVRLAFNAGSPMTFRWEDSFDLQGDPISYDFQVSKTPGFEPANIVEQQLGLTDDQTTVASLPSRTYYWRVVVRDGHPDSWQLPMIDPYKTLVVP
jgi:spore coat protein H